MMIISMILIILIIILSLVKCYRIQPMTMTTMMMKRFMVMSNSKTSITSSDTNSIKENINNINNLINRLTTASSSSSSSSSRDIEKDISLALQYTFNLASRKDSKAWEYTTIINNIANSDTSSSSSLLSVNDKATIVKIARILKEKAGLASIATSLFQRQPLPDIITLDKTMVVLCDDYPSLVLDIFSLYILPYIDHNNNNINIQKMSIIPNERCAVYAMKAITALKINNKKHGNSNQLNHPFDKIGIVELLNMVIKQGKVSVGLIVTALSSCRDLDDWQSVLQIYNTAKLATKGGIMIDNNTATDDNKGGKEIKLQIIDKLPSIVYGQTIVALVKGGAEVQAFQIVCEMLEAGVEPSTMTVDIMFLELSKRGAYKVLSSILEQLQRFSVSVSNMSLNALLNACDKGGAYSFALSLFPNKINEKQLDDVGLSVLIKCCDRLSSSEKAVSIIQAMWDANKNVSELIYQRVFAIFVKSSNSKLATQLLLNLESESKSRKFYINDDIIVESNTQLNYGRKQIVEDINDDDDDNDPISDMYDDYFLELLELTHTPIAQPEMYSAVISTLAKNGQPLKATKLLYSFLQRGGNPNEDMFTSTIFGYRQTSDPDGAEGVFRKLQQHSKLSHYKQSVDKSFNNVLNVTSASFNALLQVFGTSNVSPSRQKAIMTEMEQAGLKWDSFTYTAVIMASSTSRDDVISTWSEMIKSGIVPTAAAASEMFKACMASKNGTVALEVLNWLWNNTSPAVDEDYAWTGTNIDVRRKEDSLVPDLYMCSKVLSALGQEGKTAECLILLDKMREKDIKPSTYCYMIVLNALEKSSDWKKAVNLILQMQLRGVMVDSKAVNIVIATCVKANQWAMVLKLYELMPLLAGVKFIPNQFTFSQSINAACRVKNITAAMSILDDMLLKGQMLPPITTTSLLINTLESNGHHEESAKVYESVISCHLDFSYYEKDEMTMKIVDLHGLSISLARSAIRSALYTMRSNYLKNFNNSNSKDQRNLVIITGIGKNSKEWLEPVLKPSVQSWLESDFNPPLIASEIADNLGRLIVPFKQIESWILSTTKN